MDWSEYLGRQGRYGDTLVAHINPREAAILQALGGKGSVNPRTGLREYYEGEEGEEGEEGDPAGGGGYADTAAQADVDAGVAGMSGSSGGYADTASQSDLDAGYAGMSNTQSSAYGSVAEQQDKDFAASWGAYQGSMDDVMTVENMVNALTGLPQSIADELSTMTPLQIAYEVAKGTVKAVGVAATIAALIAEPVATLGALTVAGTKAGMLAGVKDAAAFANMTPEEQAAAIAANKTDFGTADVNAASESKWTKGKFNEQGDETEGGTLNEDGSIKTTSESEAASLLKSLNYDVSDSDAQESISEDLKSMQDQISEKLQIVDLKGAVELGKEFTESATLKAKLSRAMDNLSVLPGYEEIKDRMKVLAMKYLEKGATAEIAAATAYEKLYSQLSQLQTLRSKYSTLLG